MDSLSQKRLADARKTLPMTARALGAEFEQLLLPELDAPPSSGRHRDDAARLVARIEQGGDEARRFRRGSSILLDTKWLSSPPRAPAPF